jgi:hypothetical protein
MRNELVRVSELGGEHRDAMFSLYQVHFSDPDRLCFESDLDEKNWVILLQDDDGNLRGYSCLLIYQVRFEDTPFTIIYSGDTVMDPSAWSSIHLSRSWLTAVVELKRDHFPVGKLYWLLVSSGFRSYRFLSTYWKEFYPHHQLSTPPKRQEFLNFLAQGRFGDSYDAESGLVRLPHLHPLRDELKEIPERRLSDPHVRFYLERNPGHGEGHELVSLTEISPDNLTEAGQEIWPF